MLDKPDLSYPWVTYAELAEQYAQTAKNISDKIACLRAKERKASFMEADRLRRKIRLLYEIHHDTVKAARALREYAAKEGQT